MLGVMLNEDGLTLEDEKLLRSVKFGSNFVSENASRGDISRGDNVGIVRGGGGMIFNEGREEGGEREEWRRRGEGEGIHHVNGSIC